MSQLAAKKHRAARAGVSKVIKTFYAKAFPGSLDAPDVFWKFILEQESVLGEALVQAAENQSRIDTACRKFVDLFRKACVRARQLHDDEQTGDDGAQGGAVTRGEAARKALEDAKRPEDYWLWDGGLRGARAR